MTALSPRNDNQVLSPFAPRRRRSSARVVLMGAVAAVALMGAVANSFALSNDSAAPQPTTISSGPASFADTVERVRGAVVSVKVNVVEPADADPGPNSPNPSPFQPGDPLERFFKRFGEQGSPFAGPGGQRSKPQARKGQSQGSGFIISADGYVVTNNHVVEKASGDLTLTLENGKTVQATVVGTDKKTDLALLKIKDAGTYPFVKWSTTSPRVGDWVIAIGNPFGLGGTVTAGIVSARGRDIGAGPYDDFLQIDASVNRGNSGGPTFNNAGDVVGVNTAIYSPSGGSVGIGFAIPAEVARDVVASLKDKGSVTRGWIGVQIQPVTPDIADSLGLKSPKGALIAEAQPNSPALAAGLRSGDVILAVNGEAIDGPRELAKKIASTGPDKKVELTYWSAGKEKTASLKLGTLPNDKEARADKVAPDADKTALEGLGLSLAPASLVPGSGGEGVVVADIDPQGFAAQKGLKRGDVILEASGQAVTKPADIRTAFATAKKEGRKSVLLRVKSEQGTRFVALATNPAS